ncbi:MAG TPA: hypothetical protein V6C89_15930 [Drouetiella sp.]|jgi:hypothetical protein
MSYPANRLQDRKILYRLIVLAFIVIWGAIQAWNSRFELYFADSQQYFDSAGYFSRGDFARAVSTYWSPLYPALFALVLKFVPVSAYWQFFELKVFNLACLVGTFFAFEFFFAQFHSYYVNAILSKDPERAAVSQSVLHWTGYALFVYYALGFGGVNQDTPDMLNAALIFLASGLMLRQLSSTPTAKGACLLGITLGFGYLCKAVMASMTVIYLSLTFIFNRNIACLLSSIACFALVAAPWVITMSDRAGHLSFGESGKFVYINHVEEINPVWTDGVIHQPRVLHQEPRVVDYGDKIAGTTPIMYDYGYWAAGAIVHVRFHQVLKALSCNIFYFIRTFLYLPLLILAVATIGSRRWTLPWRALWVSAPIWVPPCALIVAYTVVGNLYIDTYITRYFIAIYPITVLALLVAVRLPGEKASLLRKICLLTAALCVLLAFSTKFVGDVADLFQEKRNVWYAAAMALKHDGIKYGDAIAQVGVRVQRNYQYAEPEKLHVVANIEDEKQFWQLSAQKRQEVLDVVKQTGARVVVYARIPDVEDPVITTDLKIVRALLNIDLKLPFKQYMPPTDLTGWKQVPGCEIYYYLLDK